METFFKIYIASWSAACLIALALFLRSPAKFAISDRKYWHFLLEPWKLVTFLVSGGVITLIAPYTGDPTWDRFDGFFMSMFCYITAPWSVATIFRGFCFRRESWPCRWFTRSCCSCSRGSWSVPTSSTATFSTSMST